MAPSARPTRSCGCAYCRMRNNRIAGAIVCATLLSAGQAFAYRSLHHPAHRHPGNLRVPYPEAFDPEPVITLPEGFVMTAVWDADALRDRPAAPFDAPGDIVRALTACWHPVNTGHDRAISVRLSFARDGRVIGIPRVTHIDALADEVADLRASLLSAISACAPLPFTPALGRAIAGRPFAIRFIAPRRQSSKDPTS